MHPGGMVFGLFFELGGLFDKIQQSLFLSFFMKSPSGLYYLILTTGCDPMVNGRANFMEGPSPWDN